MAWQPHQLVLVYCDELDCEGDMKRWVLRAVYQMEDYQGWDPCCRVARD